MSVASHVRFALPLLASIALSGCAVTPAATTLAPASGNWQVASSAAAASRLASFSGEISGSANAVTGIFHSNSASACVAPGSSFELQGSVGANSLLTLTSGNFQGGTLTLTGTLAADGKSLSGVSYTVAGGSCAFAQAATATATSYSPITGTYTGSFSDAGGQVISITANLTQNPASDTSGNFQLSGTGTFPNNPCFSSPVSIASSQVTGGSFTLTYTDSTTTNSVTATGTFSTDGKTLTVNPWTLSGPCGPDSGTGLLSR